MKRSVVFSGGEIVYELEYKRVKNINLRVSRDGSVKASCGVGVSPERVDSFVLSKADMILSAIERLKNSPQREKISYTKEQRAELLRIAGDILEKFYPIFAELGVRLPQLKVRNMLSRWGSCQTRKGIVTLSLSLLGKPLCCVEYVMMHELCHLIHPNHSKDFHNMMTRLMPDWRARKRLLNSD